MSTQGTLTIPINDKFACIAISHTADLLMDILLKHCSTSDQIALLISDLSPGFNCNNEHLEYYLETPERRLVGLGDTPHLAVKDLFDKQGLPNFSFGCHYNYLRIPGGWIEEWMSHEATFHINPHYPHPVIPSRKGFRDISSQMSSY